MNDYMQALIFYGGILIVAGLFGTGLWYGATTGNWDGRAGSTCVSHPVGTNR